LIAYLEQYQVIGLALNVKIAIWNFYCIFYASFFCKVYLKKYRSSKMVILYKFFSTKWVSLNFLNLQYTVSDMLYYLKTGSVPFIMKPW